jgi:hypothetical protein
MTFLCCQAFFACLAFLALRSDLATPTARVYKEGMADFRIHGMSEELRRKLKIRAAEEDTDMNALVLRILEEALSKTQKGGR